MKKTSWGYWNKRDNVVNEAKKYNTKNSFRRNSRGAYSSAKKHGWFKEFDWFEDGNVIRANRDRKWTYDSVRNEALKYTTKKEFITNSAVAYNVACRNKWIGDFDWLINAKFDFITDKVDSVYAYEFVDQNSVYIGRTLMRTQTQRDWQHMSREDDTVYQFATSLSISIPKMKILEDNLTVSEGSTHEGDWVDKYKREGWIILNRAKTGSIGGLGSGKWSYSAVVKEAKKYKTKKEFLANCPGGHRAAYVNGWFKEFDWFEDGRTLYHEKRKEERYSEVLLEAKKYKTKAEFRKNSPSEHTAAQKHGWIKSFDWLEDGHKIRAERDRKWTYEKTKLESLKYVSRSQFKTGSGSAYVAALKNNWLDEFFPK